MNNCPYERAIAKLFKVGSKLGNDFQKTAEFLCKALGLEYQRTTYGIACDHDRKQVIMISEKTLETLTEVENLWPEVDPKGHHVTQRRHYKNNGTIVIVETRYGNPTSLHFDWAKQVVIISNHALGLEESCDVVDVNNFKRDKQKIYDATNPANKIKPGDGLQKVLFNIMGSLIELKQRESEMICTDGSHYLLSLDHLHDAIHLLESARTRTE